VVARACAIKALNDRFVDDVTRAPREIPINGSRIEFEDITFFAVSREEFEGARLSIMPPPASGGSDAFGDMGLGRQQLLLKWLLEGQYVDVSLRLNGLGRVDVTVLDALDTPVANTEVTFTALGM